MSIFFGSRFIRHVPYLVELLPMLVRVAVQSLFFYIISLFQVSQKLRNSNTHVWKQYFLYYRRLCIRPKVKKKVSNNLNKRDACPHVSRAVWSLPGSISRNFCKSSLPLLTIPDGSLANNATEKANILRKILNVCLKLSPRRSRCYPTVGSLLRCHYEKA